MIGEFNIVIKLNRTAVISLICFFSACALIFLVAVSYKPLLRFFYPIKYQETVSKASETYGVEKELIYAIIKCESGFDEHARSRAGAVGLMQIMPETFKWLQTQTSDSKLSKEKLEDPKINIMYGTLLISILRRKYSNDDTVLSSYNAGDSVVKRWLGDKKISADGIKLDNIPYKETRNYVNKIKTAKKIYKKLYFEP